MILRASRRTSIFCAAVILFILCVNAAFSQSTASKLPLLLIDTYGQSIKDEPKVLASLKVIDNGQGQLNHFTDPPTGYNSSIGIEIRGQSSQMFPKKSYGFETIDATGNDTDASLLGMPEESDWVLYAPYSDKSMLRNSLTYYLGRRMGGEWQPRYRFCEVYINGSYNGVYMLVERIKRGEDRVNINKLKADENSGDNLSGGYIIKVDKINGLSTDEFFLTYPSEPASSLGNNEFTYVYPDWDEITPQQKQYIQNYVQTIEWSLRNADSSDPETGFRRYLDEQSFVDFQIMQELANNVDGYKYSTYFFKKKDSEGGKLYAGPLWDFDLCYGNVDYSPSRLSTAGWLYTRIGANGDNRIHWWYTMMNDRNYRKRFVMRWQELRSGALRTDSVMAYFDDNVSYLREAAGRNFTKWPILGKYVWPNAFIGSDYNSEIDYLKNWLIERLSWIDANIEKASVSDDDPYYAEFTVYPNPATGFMNIEFYTASPERISIELFDAIGRKVFSQISSPDPGGNQSIYLNLPAGLKGYHILLVRQGGFLLGRQKVVIVK